MPPIRVFSGFINLNLLNHGHNIQLPCFPGSCWRRMLSNMTKSNSTIPTYPLLRMYSTQHQSSKTENTNVGHARFLAEAGKDDIWHKGVGNAQKGGIEGTGDELEGISPGKGKLSPTSSHLLKLILPLGNNQPPTVFLLHPSQPLSHVSRLISSSLPDKSASISFRSSVEPVTQPSSRTADKTIEQQHTNHGNEVQWADSTDIGDFTKSAARSSSFRIVIEKENAEHSSPRSVIEVTVPNFERRTIYLSRQLEWVSRQLREVEEVKRSCDIEAHQSAKRLAVGGLAMLVIYWGMIFRLTFWDYGWDVMEPVSYLSGLSMIILGYLWFLYQGREVSYSSVMDTSISRRRSQLYQSRGFDIDRWSELVTEEKALKREISKIAQDYGLEWTPAEREATKRKDDKSMSNHRKGTVPNEGESQQISSSPEPEEVKRKRIAIAEKAESQH